MAKLSINESTEESNVSDESPEVPYPGTINDAKVQRCSKTIWFILQILCNQTKASHINALMPDIMLKNILKVLMY